MSQENQQRLERIMRVLNELGQAPGMVGAEFAQDVQALLEENKRLRQELASLRSSRRPLKSGESMSTKLKEALRE